MLVESLFSSRRVSRQLKEDCQLALHSRGFDRLQILIVYMDMALRKWCFDYQQQHVEC